MGFKGDIQNLRQEWSESSWLWKTLLAGNCFFASTSLASLSDIFVEWKGFFRDAISFYRAYVTEPVSSAVSHLDGKLSSVEADGLFLFGLALSGYSRARPSAGNYLLTTILFLAVGFPAAFGNFYSSSEIDGAALVPVLVATYIALTVGVYFGDRERFAVYVAPSLIALVLVGVLGAINAALAT